MDGFTALALHPPSRVFKQRSFCFANEQGPVVGGHNTEYGINLSHRQRCHAFLATKRPP